VARRADFQMQLGLGRPRLERVAARAAHVDFFVVGVNPFFHSRAPQGPERARRNHDYSSSPPVAPFACQAKGQGRRARAR
jgi:hypothetical protein